VIPAHCDPLVLVPFEQSAVVCSAAQSARFEMLIRFTTSTFNTVMVFFKQTHHYSR